MKENNGKMKKIEITLIKRFLRINWYLLSIQFWSSPSILSISHSWTLRDSLDHFSFGSIKEKKEKRNQRSSKQGKYKSATIGLLASINLHV